MDDSPGSQEPRGHLNFVATHPEALTAQASRDSSLDYIYPQRRGLVAYLEEVDLLARAAVVQPAVVGRFRDGQGEFFADDFHKDTPVLARFIWCDITKNSARWEQAFSTDDGQTWETNWTMEFARA